ncbi:hypothetical protein DY000_02007799 [Brassica cretica]|uniref:Uncharacterized protein n=1 Tax=Brassica cretica TaxID=69181 RepID=A0ABQ7BYM1_BRACR|nr:hypothetical protein DY000_02007799 [Brassica cretica]
MEGSPYRKFSISRGKGAVLGTGPGVLRSGEPGFLLAGILGTRVPSSGDPETGVLPGDIAPVVLRFRVPFRSEPYSEPEGGSVSPISDRGLVLLWPLILVEDGKLWASDGVLETAKPGALMLPEEELMDNSHRFSPDFGDFIPLSAGDRMRLQFCPIRKDFEFQIPKIRKLIGSRLLRESFQRLLLYRLLLSFFPFYFLLFRRRHLELSFLIVAIHWIGTISIMSKRSSSSIPTTADRARLKRRMESPVSRSDSSSEAGEGSDCNLMAPLPLSCVYAATPLVVRASRYIPGEIAVYEAFFDSGLRGTIPALIAGLCNLFEISASQLNPPAWRILIAIQNLGDLEYLSLGINEVLFAYHLAPLNVGEGRFHLRPRSGVPTVEELPKSDRKGPVFNKKWQERYAIMMFPGSSYRWNFIGRNCLILLLIDHLLDPVFFMQPELTMLLRKERESCSPGATSSCGSSSGELLGDMSGGNTNDPFAAYQEAAKVMSAKKGSSSRNASGDEVMITGSRRSSVVKLEPSPSLPGKRPKSGGVMTRSAQQTADMARSAGSLAVALSNLNLNVFPQDGTVLPIGDPSEVVQVLQGGILRTVSQLYHLRERLSSEDLPILREEIEDLKRQVLGERNQRAARELEVHDLKDKVKDLENVAKASSADALTASQKNQELGEEIDVLKAAAETFKFEMVMAVNGARVVARWELMREWLRKQSAQWDLATTLEQYKAVV